MPRFQSNYYYLTKLNIILLLIQENMSGQNGNSETTETVLQTTFNAKIYSRRKYLSFQFRSINFG